MEHAGILDALRAVIDPDLHEDIVSLGFIKHLTVDGGRVSFDVELTTPACPAKAAIRAACIEAVEAVKGVTEVHVRMTATTRGGLNSGDATGGLAGVRHVVAVASGKGGVGKSTTTVNLAHALRLAGARVGILDADIHGPSVQHLTGAGVPVQTSHEGFEPVDAGGIKVVSMAMFVPARRPTLLRGPRVTAVIQQFLTAFDWGELDYLLIDCPPGTGDVHITLAQVAPMSGVVVVTTPQDVAVLDVRKAVAMYETVEVPVLGVIETMSGFVCPHCDVRHPLFGEGGGMTVAHEAKAPLWAQVPLDPRVMQGGESGSPVVVEAPESPAAKAYVTAAGALASRLAVAAVRGGDALDHFRLTWKGADHG